MIVLSDTDVAALLPMREAIEVVEKAMVAVSAGETNLPLRIAMGNEGTFPNLSLRSSIPIREFKETRSHCVGLMYNSKK